MEADLYHQIEEVSNKPIDKEKLKAILHEIIKEL
jgi:hypothetical protein